MFYDLYMFDHNFLHICFWTLPAIIVGIIMVIMAVTHDHKQKKREKEFEKELEEASAPAAEIPETVQA